MSCICVLRVIGVYYIHHEALVEALIQRWPCLYFTFNVHSLVAHFMSASLILIEDQNMILNQAFM